MAKGKRGLHKEITSIFDGVPLPNNPVSPSPSAPAGGRGASERPAQPDKGRFEMPVVSGPPAAVDKPKVSEVAKPKTQAPGPAPKAVPMEKPQGNFVVKSSARSFFDNILNQITAKVLAPKPGADPGRQKVMVLLVPVLFVVFIVVFIRVLPGLKGGAVAQVQQAPTGNVSTSNGQITWETPEPYPATLRDPMQFGSISTSGGPDEGGTEVQLVVTGIVYSADSPTAVIGTKIVREGDEIMGAKVVKINPDSVDFEKDGKRFTRKVEKR